MKPIVLLLIPLAAFAAEPDARIRDAASRAVALLQKSAATFTSAQTCYSCHHQTSPLMLLRRAREHGVPVNEPAARELTRLTYTRDVGNLTALDSVIHGLYVIDSGMSFGSHLVGAHEAGIAPNVSTGAEALRLAGWQRADGSWPVLDSRPPSSSSEITSTAMSIRALDAYLPIEAMKRARIAEARKWLLTAKARTTEERAFRLFGLAWAGASESETRAAASDLLAEQRADGGWAQLPSRASDAYATGVALTALAEAGRVERSDAAWQRGIRFLLESQKPDGSWLVETRMVSPAPMSPPYFETGFPYGKNQFISAAGTGWAAMALTQALPAAAAAKPLAVPEAAPAGVKPWVATALFGSVAELRGLLDGGLDVNSATPQGTSLLMMAAPDPEKVRLLIERKANVKARAKNGFTALMIAAGYRGATDSVKQLLAAGAEVNPGKGVMFNSSPLFMAAMMGQIDSLRVLLDAGADKNRAMLLLGRFPATPLMAAVFQNDTAVAGELLRRGVDPNQLDGEGMSPLAWATLGNDVEVADLLIRSGAKVDFVDKRGYSAARYAAAVHHGDTAVLERLLKAGAERTTPLADARKFQHPDAVRVLERPDAGRGPAPR